MKNTAGFVLFVLAVLVILFFRSTGKKVPFIPDDIFHSGVSNNAACTTCHTPGKQAPLKEAHSSEEECFACHRAKQS